MVGSSVTVRVDDAAVQASFKRLVANGGPAVGALKNIGEMLLKSTRARFDREEAPDGSKWKPLNPAYAKEKQGGKILQGMGMRGGLLGSIVYQVEGTALRLGTNKVYGAIHHFGGVIFPRSAESLVFRIGKQVIFAKKVTIPARPWLGISTADRATMVEVIEDHIDMAVKG
jgi:phage virion morphogenesis protein